VATMSAAHLRLSGVDESLGGAPSGAATLFGLAGPQRLQGSAEPMLGLFVSANFFDVWRVRPILGHGFSVDDDRAVALPYPILLSENFWRRRFASDPAILGTSLLVNGYPSRVVGITPRDFMGTRPQVPDVWLPFGVKLAPKGSGCTVSDVMASPSGSAAVTWKISGKPGRTPRAAGAFATGGRSTFAIVMVVAEEPDFALLARKVTTKLPACVKLGVQRSWPLAFSGPGVKVAPAGRPDALIEPIASPSGSEAVMSIVSRLFSLPAAVAGAETTGERSLFAMLSTVVVELASALLAVKVTG